MGGELGVLAGVEDHVFSGGIRLCRSLKGQLNFSGRPAYGCPGACSYGTMHGASKGKNVKLQRIAWWPIGSA
ncbi:MAG: hypothetical protein ACLTBV_07200 [Enterocloster bolteae]